MWKSRTSGYLAREVLADGMPVAAVVRTWMAAVGVVTGVMVAIEDLGKSERRECRLETC